jgi:hypothetical protein
MSTIPRVIHHIEGPRGWTETVPGDVVDTLVQMGLIHRVRTNEATAEWPHTTHVYESGPSS